MTLYLLLLLLTVPTICSGCKAFPFVMGLSCSAGDILRGGLSNTGIHYMIATIIPNDLCCEGWACGDLGSASCTSKQFAWHWLGCSTTSRTNPLSGTLPWGSNVAQPQVRCHDKSVGSVYSASYYEV